MLSCLAEGDPAPEVAWRSPTNDRIGVSPPSDRKQTRTHAFWELRNVRIAQSGWYSCNATNAAGTRTGYTYLHVAVAGDPPANLSGFLFPTSPRKPEAATTSASVTSYPTTSPTFQRNVTSPTRHSSDHRRTTTVEFHTASTSKSTQDGRSTFGVDSTTIDGSYSTTEPTPFGHDIWEKVLLIIGCVMAGVVLVLLLFFLVVCCVRLGRKHRRRRRRTKSVPPAPRTIRDDCLRRPKPFPGISMAGEPDGQVLQASALPVSPTYGQPERLDLLSAEFDRNCDQLHTFDRNKNGGDANGCT